MIEFANLAMLGGVVAAAAPVLLHIAHRQKFRRVDWGAMRFLQEMLARRRRRLAVDNWLLLAIRVAILACLALALARPQWVGVDGQGDRIARSGRVAAVVCVDDSLSAQAVSAGIADLDRIKALALGYINTLRPGDEVSIVRLSQVGGSLPEPLYDLGAARDVINTLQPTALASDHAALLGAGLERFVRHFNPAAELVLVSDGRGDGWGDAQRFAVFGRRLRPEGAEKEHAVLGTRAAPQLIILSPVAGATLGDLGLTGLTLDRSLVAEGTAAVARIRVTRSGQVTGDGVRLRLSLDGRVVEERDLPSDLGAGTEISIPIRFPLAGSRMVEATLAGVRDALPMDDRRALAVEVERRLPVLLVEGRSLAADLAGPLGLVAAALDPAGRGEGLFAPQRILAARLDENALAGARVVILGDVTALDATATAALERWVAAGGGLLIVPGPGTEPDLANRLWWRGGDGLLPCALGPIGDLGVANEPAGPDLGHPAMGGFQGTEAAAWSGATVRRRFALEMGGGRESGLSTATRLLGLADGSPLVVQRSRGLGTSILISTSLDGNWGDLPFRPAFVPLIRGIVAHLGATVLPPRNLLAGDRLAWIGATEGAACAGPDGRPVILSPGSWEGKPALLSPPLAAIGPYELRIGQGDPIRYAVTLDQREAGLTAVDNGEVDGCIAPAQAHRAATPETVAPLFAEGRGTGRDMWHVLVILAAGLLLAETMLTRRQATDVRSTKAVA